MKFGGVELYGIQELRYSCLFFPVNRICIHEKIQICTFKEGGKWGSFVVCNCMQYSCLIFSWNRICRIGDKFLHFGLSWCNMYLLMWLTVKSCLHATRAHWFNSQHVDNGFSSQLSLPARFIGSCYYRMVIQAFIAILLLQWSFCTALNWTKERVLRRVQSPVVCTLLWKLSFSSNLDAGTEEDEASEVTEWCCNLLLAAAISPFILQLFILQDSLG